MVKRVVFLILLQMFLSFAFSQDLRSRSQLDKSELYAGETAVYSILIQGTNYFDPPNIEVPPSFEIEYLGGRDLSQTTRIAINGVERVNEEKAFGQYWQIKGFKEGNFTIPAQSVSISGKQVQVPAVSLKIKPTVKLDNYKLRLSSIKDTYYWGEKVILTTELLFAKQVNDLSFEIDYLEKFPDSDAYNPPDPNTDDVYSIHYKGHQFGGRIGSVVEGRKQFATMTFSHEISPAKTGLLHIPAVSLNFKGEEGARTYRDFFGNLVKEPQYKRMFLRTEPLSLSIQPLPESGKPTLFSGLIGDLSGEAAINRTTARVGDPLELSLELQGLESSISSELPLFYKTSQWKDFQVELLESQRAGDKWQYSLRVRPLTEGVESTPDILIPYFDTAKKRYSNIKIKAIPLEISSSGSMEIILPPSEVEASEELAPGYKGYQEESLLEFFIQFLFLLLWPLFLLILLFALALWTYRHGLPAVLRFYQESALAEWIRKNQLYKKSGGLSLEDNWLPLWQEICLLENCEYAVNLANIKGDMKDQELMDLISKYEEIKFNPRQESSGELPKVKPLFDWLRHNKRRLVNV